jgi:cytidylate kinase
MSSGWGVAPCQALISAEANGAGAGRRRNYRDAMARSVICVSHQTGAGGRELAAAVAEHLGYRYVDEEVVQHAAETEGVTEAELADAERRKSFFERIMYDFGRSGGGAMYGAGGVSAELMVDLATPDQLREAIRRAIEDIASEGRVVIASHAASHALAGPNVLRVFVVAPEEIRSARIAESEGLDRDDAAKTIVRHDTNRADYLKRFYGVAAETPDQYDLVVNTGDIAPEALAPLIANATAL